MVSSLVIGEPNSSEISLVDIIILPSLATTEGGTNKPTVLEPASGIISASRNTGGPGRMIGLNSESPVSVPSFLLSKGFRTC